MPIARIALIAAVCGALAACTATPKPMPVAAAKPAVAPDPPLDGAYWGTSTWFRADRRDCPRPGLVRLTVQKGQFQYPWNRGTVVDATVDPDGTVHGQAPNITLEGRRDGRRIEGDVTNGYCGLHFTVTLRKP